MTDNYVVIRHFIVAVAVAVVLGRFLHCFLGYSRIEWLSRLEDDKFCKELLRNEIRTTTMNVKGLRDRKDPLLEYLLAYKTQFADTGSPSSK